MLPRYAFLAFLALGWAAPASAAAAAATQLEALAGQNRRLQAQVDEQRQLIERLTARLDALERGSAPPPLETPAVAVAGEIRISGEAGLAFFDTGPNGTNPNGEFRADDAKIFLAARIWQNAFLFAGLELVTREANDEFFHLGELYVDFENVAAGWGRSRALNVRAGRFYIPFGEEYQLRGVMANPLISHSVSDIWGIDEGVGIYGSLGRVDYVAAVQNGGDRTMRDFNSDKSVAGRLGFTPRPWLRLSGSAMRTGDLDSAGDFLSAQWFGGGFFRALSNAPTFDARLYEADAIARWDGGRLSLTAGRVLFSESTGDSRRMRYYGAEAMQQLSGGLYAAARYSRLHAPRGYALAGLGNFGTFFFGNSITDELRRLSLGLGYRFGAPLVLKAEYTVERGRMTNGKPRENEDMIASELGVRF